MPRKIRELEAALKKAGFVWNSGKGSHRKWFHATGVLVVMSGRAGQDAKRYQERAVEEAIQDVEEQSKRQKT